MTQRPRMQTAQESGRAHELLDDRLGPYQLIRRKREKAIVGLY